MKAYIWEFTGKAPKGQVTQTAISGKFNRQIRLKL